MIPKDSKRFKDEDGESLNRFEFLGDLPWLMLSSVEVALKPSSLRRPARNFLVIFLK